MNQQGECEASGPIHQECLGLVVDTSLTALRVMRELDCQKSLTKLVQIASGIVRSKSQMTEHFIASGLNLSS